MGKFIDITGQQFNSWTVVKRSVLKTSSGHLQWICRCTCGTVRTIIAGNLKNNSSASCGCSKIKHGHARRGQMSGAYKSWHKMMQRCYNPAADEHFNYGKRGIAVVDRWHNFENFLADMGDRPEGLTLDRITNSEDYSFENCRWATRKEQANNRG